MAYAIHQKKLGAILILCVVIIGVIIFYRYRSNKNEPIIFSSSSMLQALWNSYKSNYLEPGTGRTLDKQQNNITTSEGESYTMLRAVWMDDQTTFDQSLSWLTDNLHRSSDSLPAWLFGQRSDGSYGVITERGGNNTASDGDTDIALSLVLAYDRWGNPLYLQKATAMISDIWDKEVVTIAGRPYLAANDLEKTSKLDTVVVNPSYLAPYAYRIFDRIDTNSRHNWGALIDSSYDILNRSIVDPLDTSTSAHIPPDWIVINRTTGIIQAPNRPNLTSNYSYDAFRVPFRLALDWQWNKESRAKEVLNKISFLGSTWKSDHKLMASYSHDGNPLVMGESPAAYGASLGYFMYASGQTSEAKKIYESKLVSLYNPDTFSWKQSLSYYDDNWAWFGIALYQSRLINLDQT